MIHATQRHEFERALIEIPAGEWPRMGPLKDDMTGVAHEALKALAVIETAIESHPTTVDEGGGALDRVRTNRRILDPRSGEF